MKKKILIAVGLLAVSLFAWWQARLHADHRHAEQVVRSLCSEIKGYRQWAGHLPPSLDAIADGKKADWLKDLTNGVSVAYDPGASDRMPRLDVSVGYASIALQGADFFDYPL